jgi:hypothetical protein
VATKAADNGGGRAAAVEKNGFCVFSIFMSKKEAVCPDGRIVPAVFRVSGFYVSSIATVLFFANGFVFQYLLFFGFRTKKK